LTVTFDAETWVALGAAVISACSAAVAVSQARSAKRQAAVAEHQLALTAKQLTMTWQQLALAREAAAKAEADQEADNYGKRIQTLLSFVDCTERFLKEVEEAVWDYERGAVELTFTPGSRAKELRLRMLDLRAQASGSFTTAEIRSQLNYLCDLSEWLIGAIYNGWTKSLRYAWSDEKRKERAQPVRAEMTKFRESLDSLRQIVK